MAVVGAESAADAAARLRAGVEDGQKEAQGIWEQAERALDKTLRDAKRRGDLIRDSEAPLPLRRDRSQAQRGRAGGGGGTSPTQGALRVASDPEDAALRASQRAARVAAAREKAPQAKAHLMLKRAAESRDNMANHGKRKLRAKVVDIIQEVRRREALEQQQNKLRGFREHRQQSGLGPSSSVGDADPYSLGLFGVGGKVKPDHVERGASPRRSQILESLSLEELDMLRRDPRFVFECPALAPGAGGLGGASTSTVGEEGGWDESVQSLIEFFMPTREERDQNVSVEGFAQRLRSQLAEEAANAKIPDLPDLSPPRRKASEADGPLEKMPCQGRRPAFRKDEQSPTLAKVREVYNRKEEADAKWVEDKREAMLRRININEFKAKEQQREAQLQATRTKEIAKVRMMEVEERKAVADAQAQERWELMDANWNKRMVEAHNQWVDTLEEKRAKASDTLDNWQEGVEKCERHLRLEERQRIQHAEVKWDKYMDKLWKLGISKHSSLQSQAQKNDELRTKIQTSLIQQQKEQRQAYSEKVASDLEAKLEAANIRRINAMKGNRYKLIEKAFGHEALGYDAKFHSYHTDRRMPEWKESSGTWEQHETQRRARFGRSVGGSRSEPNLGRTRGSP